MTGGRFYAFLMLFHSSGAVKRIFFGDSPRQFDLDMKEALAESSPSWLFCHPFEAPEYTWIAWQNIERTVMERFIGSPFDPSDFGPVHPVDVMEPIEFPASWGVMY